MLPLAIGIGAAILVVVAVLVIVFVAKPGGGNAQKGVWVQTKTVSSGKQGNNTWNAQYQYELDEAGNPIVLKYSYNDSNGNKTEASESHTFDKSGQSIASEITTNGKTENYTIEWDSLGDERPKSMHAFNSKDKKQERVSKYEYNDQGFIKRVTTEETSENGGKTNGVIDFSDDGQPTHEESKSDNEQFSSDTTYERDRNNRVVSCTSKGTSKDSEQVTKSTFEYDENGNMVHEVMETTLYSNGVKGDTITSDVTCEYTYVENPSPWRRAIQHLYFGSPRVF